MDRDHSRMIIILFAGIFSILLVLAVSQAYFDWSDLPPALILLFIVYCLVAHRWVAAIVEKNKSDRKTSI
jgi:hypothetical protein